MLTGIISDIWWTQYKREQILQSLWCADNRSPSHPGTSPAFSEHTHIAHYAHFHVQPSFMAGVVILSYSNIGYRISGTFLLRLRKRPFSKPDTRCMKLPENLPPPVVCWTFGANFRHWGYQRNTVPKVPKNDISLRIRKYKNKALILLNSMQYSVNRWLKSY